MRMSTWIRGAVSCFQLDADKIRVIDAFIARGININAAVSAKDTALTWVCRKGAMREAVYLLSIGANPTIPSPLGDMPLMLAARRAAEGTANLIDAIFASPHAQDMSIDKADAYNKTCLMYGCEGNIEMVKSLLKNGANTNEAPLQLSPLMLACWHETTLVVELLLKHGANANPTPFHGQTPLMYAADRGNMDCVERLLAAGARVGDTTESGVTAMMLALKNGHTAVATAILSHTVPVARLSVTGPPTLEPVS
jgi:ankyrin repeat protein